VRYRILALAFALAVAVAPVAYAVSLQRRAASAASEAPIAAIVPRLPTGPVLAGLALVATLLLLGLARDVIRLRRVKRAAVPVTTALVRAARVRVARIGTSDRVATPTAVGYLHPAVILPHDFRDRVDDAEWDAVLAHECAHLARHDDWAKALQSAFSRAAWWLPGLWFLSAALDLERELASDEHAAGHAGPRRYAACLLRLATHRSADAAAVAFWGRRSHVAIRVERLVRPTSAAQPLARAAALGAFTAVAIASVAAAVLSVPGHAPQALAARRPHAAVAVPLARRRTVARRPASPHPPQTERDVSLAGAVVPAAADIPLPSAGTASSGAPPRAGGSAAHPSARGARRIAAAQPCASAPAHRGRGPGDERVASSSRATAAGAAPERAASSASAVSAAAVAAAAYGPTVAGIQGTARRSTSAAAVRASLPPPSRSVADDARAAATPTAGAPADAPAPVLPVGVEDRAGSSEEIGLPGPPTS
jgi:beta-lactamase regulating signal transducer with metallopeptidase domain